jgi:galactitol PTS system EIIA component
MKRELHVSHIYFVRGLAAKTDAEVIRALAGRLGSHVKASFAEAAVIREKRSPTGLPFPDVAVALPHAEPEHVESPALVVASLAKPVRFRQMGSPKVVLEVGLVVMPALTAKEQAAAGLASLLTLLQDVELRRALLAAESEAAMQAALGEPA